MSGVGCGCDASLYLVKMKDADRFGPNYCDIQGVGGSAPCAEIDLFEGNRQAIASTVHMTQGTGADGTCNQDGCTEKWGEHETNTRGELVSELYGPGGNIDTTLPFQVAATFYPDGTVTIEYMRNAANRKEMAIAGGKLAGGTAEIDELFCFSFVMKDCNIHLSSRHERDWSPSQYRKKHPDAEKNP